MCANKALFTNPGIQPLGQASLWRPDDALTSGCNSRPRATTCVESPFGQLPDMADCPCNSTVIIVPFLWTGSHHQILQSNPLAGGELVATLPQVEKGLDPSEVACGSAPGFLLWLSPVSGFAMVFCLWPQNEDWWQTVLLPWGAGDLGSGLIRILIHLRT